MKHAQFAFLALALSASPSRAARSIQAAQAAHASATPGNVLSATEHGWRIDGSTFRAEVEGARLRFENTTAGARLALNLVRVERIGGGESPLSPTSAPTRVTLSDGDAVATPFAMADLTQWVRSRPSGVELTFGLAQRAPFAGAAAARLVFELEADLAQLSVATDAQHVERIAGSGRGALAIGRATLIDARGRHFDLRQGADEARYWIELPAEVLQAAAWPVVIDPLITTVLDLSASPSTRDTAADVAFDAGSNEYVAAWLRTLASGDTQVVAARVRADGTLAAPAFPVADAAGAAHGAPRLAVDPKSGVACVAYTVDDGVAPRTVEWSLVSSAGVVLASQSFVPSGALSDESPDVGFVDAGAGATGFVLAHRRVGAGTSGSRAVVSWIDAVSGALVDSKVAPGPNPGTDGNPSVPQRSASGTFPLVFQRFVANDLDVFSLRATFASSKITLAAVALDVSADPDNLDGRPDVAARPGGYRVAWEHVQQQGVDTDVLGRELDANGTPLGLQPQGVTSLGLLETSPALATDGSLAPCAGTALVAFNAAAAGAGAPTSVLALRWDSSAATTDPFEILALGNSASTFGRPRVAFDASSTTQPRFLVVFDDDGAGSNDSAEVFAQLYTLLGSPSFATVSPPAASPCVGAGVTLTVQPAPTSGNYAFQWRKDGVDIAGATSQSLALVGVSLGDSGAYDARVSGACGAVLSSAAQVSVASAPTSVAVVGAAAACEGEALSLSASVQGGSGAFAFQWFKDGLPIAGANSAQLDFAVLSAADSGQYAVSATNACAGVNSTDHALTVGTPPSAAALAVDVPQACAAGDVTFTASASGGTPPLTFELWQDGALLASNASGVFVLSGVTQALQGSYQALAKSAVSDCAGALSNAVALEVFDVPQLALLDAAPSAVTLSWPWLPAGCPSVDHFEVWRATDGQAAALAGAVPAGGSACLQFVDDGSGPAGALVPGQQLRYVVRGVDAAGALASESEPVTTFLSDAALAGDATGDGRVDGRDLIAVAMALGSCQGQAAWDPPANTDASSTCASSTACGLSAAAQLIDDLDAAVVLSAFGAVAIP